MSVTLSDTYINVLLNTVVWIPQLAAKHMYDVHGMLKLN